MAQVLMNQTKNKQVLSKLEIAAGFFARGKGLLGRSSLSPEQGLLILWTNSIHTYFMKFTIDCIFLDRNMKVKAIRKNIRPWRLILPVWGAIHVIEVASGAIDNLNVELGDQLNVVG